MRRGLKIIVALTVLVIIAPMAYMLAYVVGLNYLYNLVAGTYKYILDSLAYYLVKILPELLRQLGLM